MAKIYIIFYSLYGHVYQMAKAVKEGVDAVPGCEGVLYQVRPLQQASLNPRAPATAAARCTAAGHCTKTPADAS